MLISRISKKVRKIQRVKFILSLVLLTSLPTSYKRAAIECYKTENHDVSIFSAANFALGGIIYRFRRIYFAIVDSLLSIAQFSSKISVFRLFD